MLDSGPEGPRFKSKYCQSGDSQATNTQQLFSVQLIDENTTNHINSFFCYIPQRAALQILQPAALTFQKSMTHFIAQSLLVSAHKHCGQQSAHMHAAHGSAQLSLP
ncbi:hypothetical protein AVEN_165876-1 [Araneus ventricosus]|uniref:Uncharacterized protein n=1 Tax=Araneus ventricosus TaxID=182803 RepID=A0A4Y2K6X0_ARAVE|nr:hypothetical protein AVEN_165876-1 [Araneus ventricosus]